MGQPFFSIVIPTFNQSNFLKESLNSVFNQDFKNFEVIVVDNFSKDKTQQVIKSYKEKIIYRRIRNNGVIAKSRNIGIKKSRGKWIAFLDSDDYWSKSKLSKVFNYLKKKKDVDVICNNEWQIYHDSDKTRLRAVGPESKNFYKKILLYGNRNSTSASVVKSSFLKKNNISFNEKKSFTTCEDYCFFLDIANKNGKFHFLNEPLGTRRFHPKSSSSMTKRHLSAEMSVLEYHVYKVQTFESNKKYLMRKIKRNLFIKKNLFYIIKSKKIDKNFFNLLIFTIKNPLEISRFILFISLKFFKQIIIKQFYKN